MSRTTGRSRETRTLPIRSIGDTGLADALVEHGCPLCRVRQNAAREYLASVLDEHVTDRRFRQQFEVARGFCRAHVHELLKTERAESGGSVATAILVAASLRVRLKELERAPTGDGRRARPALQQASRPPACPACEAVVSAERHGVKTLIDRTDDPTWRAALVNADLCLDDLLLLWSAAAERGDRAWPEIASAHLARIRALADRMDGFVYHSSYDRRELMTDDERKASDEGAALLGGSTGQARR